MIAWVKKLLRIVREFETVAAQASDAQTRAKLAEAHAHAAEDLIRDRTTLHADIGPHPKAENFVVLIGNYRGRAYIQSYGIGGDTFPTMVENLRGAAKAGQIGVIDAPPQFRAVICREF